MGSGTNRKIVGFTKLKEISHSFILVFAFFPNKAYMSQNIHAQWDTNDLREHWQHFFIKETSA
jgi:hypothetical protein